MRVVIIGNGAAGNSAASIIREHDKHVKLTMISEEEVPYYATCALTRYISNEISKKELFLRKTSDYVRSNINTIFGQKVDKINVKKKAIFLKNRELEYDRLIIATGSKPIIPKIPGIRKEGVFPLKTLSDVDKILSYSNKVVTVIGSGPIGVATAIALRKKGYKVNIIEMLDHILPKLLDAHPSSIVKGILEKKGIIVFTNETVSKVIGRKKVEGVETSNGEIKCGLIILAVGMKPRIDAVTPNEISIGKLEGITTGLYMNTSVKDVYACGDCVESTNLVTRKTTLNLLWPNARQQGRVAGLNSIGVKKEYPGSVNINTIDVFGTHVASIGCNQIDVDPSVEYEILEKKYGNQYHAIIVSNGRIIGAQSIERLEHMGVLLKAVRKQTRIDDIKKMGYQREYFLKNPWYMKFNVYL